MIVEIAVSEKPSKQRQSHSFKLLKKIKKKENFFMENSFTETRSSVNLMAAMTQYLWYFW